MRPLLALLQAMAVPPPFRHHEGILPHAAAGAPPVEPRYETFDVTDYPRLMVCSGIADLQPMEVSS